MSKRILASALAIFFIIGFLPACIGTPGVKAPAEIVVNKLEVTPNEVGVGETVTVKADISNIGGLSENFSAILNVDGKERDRQTVYINPAENKTVSFAVKEPNIGQHEITIGSSNNNIKTIFAVSAEKVTTFKAVNYANPTYNFFIKYPDGWIRATTTVEGTVFSAKGSDADRVIIIVRPATNFREAAITFLRDLMAAYGMTTFGTPIYANIDSQSTITLADGTQADVIIVSVPIGPALGGAITGVLKDGNAIMICVGFQAKNMRLYKEIGSTLEIQTTTPNTAAVQPGENKTTQVVPVADNQLTQLQGIPFTIKSYRGYYLQNQIAVWHPYYRVQQMGNIPGGTRPDERCPITIIPGAAIPIDSIQPVNVNDEKELLRKPGWGLGTTFSPPKTPFSVTNIKMAAVSFYTQGYFGDYYKKYVLINILDENANIIWSKYYPWSDFRNIDPVNKFPNAAWRDLAVDNVTVYGDFTVDILAFSDAYNTSGTQCSYFAVAFGSGPNSFISNNGKRSATCNFDGNLFISIDGIY